MLSYCSANGRLHPSTAFCHGSCKSGLPGKNQTTKVLIFKLFFCNWTHWCWPSLLDRSHRQHQSSAKARESPSGWPGTGRQHRHCSQCVGQEWPLTLPPLATTVPNRKGGVVLRLLHREQQLDSWATLWYLKWHHFKTVRQMNLCLDIFQTAPELIHTAAACLCQEQSPLGYQLSKPVVSTHLCPTAVQQHERGQSSSISSVWP